MVRIKAFLFLLLVFAMDSVLSSGFVANTLVYNESRVSPIEDLKELDKVISFDFKKNELTQSIISSVSKKKYKEAIKLKINGTEIISSLDQKFYCPMSQNNNWIKAKDLKVNDLLLINSKFIMEIQYIEIINEENEFIIFETNEHANYFVTTNAILVSN